MAYADAAPPDWSPLPDGASHAQFTSLVQAVLDRADMKVVEVDGPSWRVVDEQGADLRVDLSTLATLCRDEDREAWAELVVAHLGPLLAPDPMATLEHDPEALRTAVRVRLYPTEALDTDQVDPPSRQAAEGLSEVVVVDTDDTVLVVDADRYGVLGLSQRELFRLGRDNLREHEPLDLEPRDAGGVGLLLAEGDSFFTASWALLLDEAVDLPADGALVVVPSRHALVAHPLEDGDAVRAVQVLLGVAHQHAAESPGRLTPDLYWFHDGGLHLLPTEERDDGQLAFHPPDDFVEVLNRLVA
jgi:hypothetical protein